MANHYLQDTEVADRFGVSRATIWRWTKNDPSFPKPVHLSPGCSRWPVDGQDGLEAWERSKAAPQTGA